MGVSSHDLILFFIFWKLISSQLLLIKLWAWSGTATTSTEILSILTWQRLMSGGHRLLDINITVGTLRHIDHLLV